MDNRINVQNKVNCMKDSMVGCKYRHFKGGIYMVTDIAVHSETEEPMVIYYSCDHPDYVWCRPLSMFLSAVDREKYPDVEQKMRFEKVGDENEKKVEQLELKSCPICGSTIDIDKDMYIPERDWRPKFYDPDSGGDPIAVNCKCGLSFSTGTYDWKEFVEAWNRRAANE